MTTMYELMIEGHEKVLAKIPAGELVENPSQYLDAFKLGYAELDGDWQWDIRTQMARIAGLVSRLIDDSCVNHAIQVVEGLEALAKDASYAVLPRAIEAVQEMDVNTNESVVSDTNG